jgi:hypothetical protein
VGTPTTVLSEKSLPETAVLSKTDEPAALLSNTPGDELTTELEVLSGGFPVEEVTTTQESEADYDILIQGSDRKYPAIVIRRKHRGKGATIKTISKFGKHAGLYADYEPAIEAYQARREGRQQGARARRDSQDSNQATGDEWVDKALQSAFQGSDNSQKGDPGV